MSDDVLTQAEVESLLNSAGNAPKPEDKRARPATTRGRNKVSPYDFKRPERVGKEQMRGLQSLHEGFGRNFGAALSTRLRTIVDVKLTSVDQLTYSEFVFSLDNPTCFNVIEAKPLDGHLILDINPSILYPVIDRMLGGTGTSSPPQRRPLTEIEIRLVSNITSSFLYELRQSWINILELDLSVSRVESNPQLVQIVPPNEVVVVISFEASFGESRGMLNLCIPFNSVERISSKLTSNSWSSFRPSTDTEETRRKIQDRIANAKAEMVVTMARTQISAGHLIGLRVGDIITTDHDVENPLEVSVEGVKKFTAAPGVLKGRKAIQIEDQLEEQK